MNIIKINKMVNEHGVDYYRSPSGLNLKDTSLRSLYGSFTKYEHKIFEKLIEMLVFWKTLRAY